MRPRLTITILLVACLGMTSCRPSDRVTITGTVTFDGKPVEAGAIVFTPLDSAIGPDGGPITAGRFAVSGRPGRRRVEVRGTRPMDDALVPKTMPRLGGLPVLEDYIPAEYNTLSTLEVDVSATGPNTFDFDLEVPR